MRRYWTAIFAAGLIGLGSMLPVSAADSHYLCDFPDSHRYLQHYRWFPYEFPVKVYVPPVPPDLKVDKPTMYTPVVKKAFATWTSKVPGMRFQFVNSFPEAQIVVKWHDYFPDESTWGQAMFPRPEDKAGKLYHTSQLYLAVRAQPGTAIIPGAVLFSDEELLGITIHEVGHALGLPHSTHPDDIMYPRIQRTFTQGTWTLSSRDVTSLKTLYALPIDKDESPCKKK